MIYSLGIFSLGIIVFCIGFFFEYTAFRTFDFSYLNVVDFAYPVALGLCIIGALVFISSMVFS